jgi:NADPH:quinone reductase-like Zn-dependent oxidoreductase
MKSVVIDEFGGPGVLHVADRELPEPGAGQVRVRVRAAGVNGIDGTIRSGAAQQMFPTELPAVLGIEVAGTIALATTVAPKPAELGWTEAASLPVAAETALRVLRLLEVTQGDTLLIHGAAGGVGTVAVQLAVARGATVIGTASEANHDHLRELGAIPMLYGDGLVERVRAAAPDGVDAVFDAAGRGALPDSIELRGGTSRIVTIADPAAFGLGIPFSGDAARDAGDLAEVARQAADGRLRVTVAETYPLEEARAAHEAVATGHGRGKVVLLVD